VCLLGPHEWVCRAELLRRTFAIEVKCAKCGSPLRLIALIKTRPGPVEWIPRTRFMSSSEFPRTRAIVYMSSSSRVICAQEETAWNCNGWVPQSGTRTRRFRPGTLGFVRGHASEIRDHAGELRGHAVHFVWPMSC
jgi:hypothetical protein